jgi:MFS family permease
VVNATFGLFLVPISRDLGWRRAQVSMVLLVVAVLSALSTPLVGRLADRFGVRRVALTGIVLFAASVGALSGIGPALAHTLLLFACLGVAASIPSAMLYAKLVSGWFVARRGLMLGLVGGVGNGLGCVLMPALATVVIARHGWRDAYLALGATVLAVGLPALWLLVRDPVPRDHDETTVSARGVTLGQAIATRRFWLILLVMALGAGSLTAIFTHVVALLTDRGLPPALATSALSTIALVGSAWQLVLGHVLDRARRPLLLAPFFVLAIGGLPLLATATSIPAVMAGAVLIGLAIGTDYGAVPYLIGRYFGLRAFGAISGLIYGINVIVLGAAPFLTDLVFDRTGSYRGALIAVAACLALCAMLCLALPAYRTQDGAAAGPG